MKDNHTLAPWRNSLGIFLFFLVLLPPLGLVLLWLRPTSTLRKVCGSVLIILLSLICLRVLFGLRMELDGTGMYPIFFFHKTEAHYSALEQNRVYQREKSLSTPAIKGQPQALRSETQEAPDDHSVQMADEATLQPPSSQLIQTARKLYWTDFRGPARDGRYDGIQVLTEWPSAGPPLMWRQPIGGGYASFVIAQGRAFTIEQRRDQEVVTAYELKTGEELWSHGWKAEFRESMGGNGPRATPTWNDGRVYSLGALGDFVCLEAATGKLVWSLNILEENQAFNLPWGMSASPLIVEEMVIVLPGGLSGSSVAAYDKLTGEPIWKSLDDQQAYTSPMLVSLAGRRQLLAVSAERVIGLLPTDGSLLWDYTWVTEYGVNSAQPIVLGDSRFFISAGYGHGAAVVEVTQNNHKFSTRPVWKTLSMKNKFTSSVLYEGHIYGLDEGILACVDAEVGKRKWKGGRYGHGQTILADGHLIVLTEKGDLVLLKATAEEHRELARFSAIRGKTWNHPAIGEDYLLVRNATQMACFDISRSRRNQASQLSTPLWTALPGSLVEPGQFN